MKSANRHGIFGEQMRVTERWFFISSWKKLYTERIMYIWRMSWCVCLHTQINQNSDKIQSLQTILSIFIQILVSIYMYRHLLYALFLVGMKSCYDKGQGKL